MADDRGPALEALRRLNDAGYLFYLDRNRTRADDLLVRAHAADCLHRAAAALSRAEQNLRRAIPAPSRETPFPDPALLGSARALKALQERIALLETRLRGPALLPDGDFSTKIPTEDLHYRLVSLDAALLDCAAAIETGAMAPLEPAFSSLLNAAEQAISKRNEISG